jgi:hypothetical protein
LSILAVITTDANEVVADIHDRMLVILAPGDYARATNLIRAGYASIPGKPDANVGNLNACQQAGERRSFHP